MWWPLANPLSKKIPPKWTLRLLPYVVAHLVEKLHMLILMQNYNKLLNNIVVYLYRKWLSQKKSVLLHMCDCWCNKCQFFLGGGCGATMLFNKYEGYPNYKYDNFVGLYSHLNGNRLHFWREVSNTKISLKHSEDAIDKIRLFSMNQLFLTCVESKFCMGRLVIVMMWRNNL